MGGNNSRELAEQTERQRIAARNEVEKQKLGNERQRDAESHANAMKNADHQHNHQMAETANTHQQKIKGLENERKADEDAHQLKLKNHEKEMKKSEDDQKYRMEELGVKKFEITCNHDQEIGKIKEKGEDSKRVSEAVMALINMDLSPTAFAYKAEIASKMLRGEKADTDTMNMIGQHHQKLEEARMQYSIGGGGGGRSARRQVLRDAEEPMTENDSGHDTTSLNDQS